jgi:ABC-type polysaccharide/polyol phosphate transport system ATPase subunit
MAVADRVLAVTARHDDASEAAISLRGVTLDYPIFDADRSFRTALLRGRVGGLIRRDSSERRTAVRALSDLTLDIFRGDRVALIGPNGAGKSTLLRTLSGSYVPTTGDLRVRGRVSSLLGLGVGIDPDETGHENIITGGLLLGLNRGQIDRIVEDVAEFCELGEYLAMPVRTYSSGMLVRLAFGIATAITPDILLIDEVLGVGDARFAAKAEARMTRLMSSASALVLASHSHELLRRFCNKGLFIVGGSIQCFGTIDEAVDAYARWVADGT